jgi:diamine N-acetyltransferase
VAIPSSAPLQHLTLRAAIPDDAICLSVLAMQVFPDTYATRGIRPAIAREVHAGYSEQVFAAAIESADVRLCVAEPAGHLVGFAQVTVGAGHELAPRGTQSELLRLYVQERFTGRHVGTRLLAEAERLAADSGASVLWLTPWAHNERALRFYERRGYTDFGVTWFTFEGESHENRLYAKRLAGATRAPVPTGAPRP